jgi:hypothetical protein
MDGMSHPDGRLDPTERPRLDNNKAFAAWMLLVVGGAGTLLLTLILTGAASLPPLPTLIADVALGLSVRFAYKWVGGFESADWSLAGVPSEEAIGADDLQAHPGTAGAMG